MQILPHTLPAIIGLPWEYLAIALAICLTFSALGFKRVEYFVSLGYCGLDCRAVNRHAAAVSGNAPGLGTGAGGATFSLRTATGYISRHSGADCVLPEAADGKRLTRHAGARSDEVGHLGQRLGSLRSDVLAGAANNVGAGSRFVTTIGARGVALMVVGLGLEACADWQKSRFKQTHHDRFCDVGLYRIVRFPNYFGEMIFWLGSWISAMSAFQSPLAWLLGGFGFVCIELVMLGSSRRLEMKQTNRYGSDTVYQAYARTTPILFQWCRSTRC